ncbi:Uncharacterised protein [Catenibacterium mitsuokai]|nr:Uncharacterised protein [Catenibacterium mitsuokai]
MFPFDDDPHTACIVCRHVLSKEEAIAYITHDEDGMYVIKNILWMMQGLYL